ncbi:MAG: hypothetical protein Kow0020_00320 [Wenzhouxiangellaceae bacterium]
METSEIELSRQAAKLFRSGQLEEAEALLSRLAEREQPDWQHLLLLALCHQQRGALDSARSLLERTLKLADSQAAPHYYLGRLELQCGAPDRAREQFAQAVRVDPNLVDARVELARLAEAEGDLTAAIREYRTALRARAEHVPALTGLAAALLAKGDPDEAERHAALAVRITPADPDAQAVMGRIFAVKGHDGFAAQCFANALKARPDHRQALLGMARLKAAQGELDGALEHYHRLVRAHGMDLPLGLEIAQVLLRLGDHDQARRLLKQLLDRDPGFAEAAVLLVELLLHSDQPEAALEVLEGVHDDAPLLTLARARTLRALGRSDEAVGLLESMIEDGGLDTRIAEAVACELADLRSERDPDAPETALALLDGRTGVEAQLTASMIEERAGRLEAARQRIDALDDDAAGDARRRVIAARRAWLADRTGDADVAWQAWRQARRALSPHRHRLDTADREWTRRWLEVELPQTLPAAGEEAPTVVVVGGWAGSGREIVLSALRRQPGLVLMDPERAVQRRDALGVPDHPAEVLGWRAEQRRLARRRFLRGTEAASQGVLLLDADWWPAGRLASLLALFPEVRVLAPEIEWHDQLVQWLAYGFRDLPALAAEWREDRALTARLKTLAGEHWLTWARDRIVVAPDHSVAELIRELGLEPDPRALDAALRHARRHPLVAPGAGSRHAARLDAEFGPEQAR